MVQVYTMNGIVGTLLTESDLNKMIEFVDGRGKKKYFIPCKKSCCPVFDSEELKKLIREGKTNDELAEYYGKSASWINSKLITVFGTTSHKIIMGKINDPNL
jgi:hypothetical protein